MSTAKTKHIRLAGLKIDVIRKDIKNLHLGVYPPHGRVRIAAPLRIKEDAIRVFASSKLGWINRHRKRFATQARETPREYVSGESHFWKGKRYLLKVQETEGQQRLELGASTMKLLVRPRSSKAQRERVVTEWYRQELKKQIPKILQKWEQVVGTQATEWGVKKMRTRWGTCNIKARRIWINLELAKKPTRCLEFIVCHELVHLLEKHHNDRFKTYMDTFMPRWRSSKNELNSLILGHFEWQC